MYRIRILVGVVAVLVICSSTFALPSMRIEVARSAVWLHPQILANDYGDAPYHGGNGSRIAIAGEVKVKPRLWAGVEFSRSEYPFIHTQYGAIPAVWPPYGRPGENGDDSRMMALNLTLKYDLRDIARMTIITGGFAAVTLGVAQYTEGERRWDAYLWDWNAMEYVRHPNYYVIKGKTKPAVPTAGCRVGFELVRLRRFDLNIALNSLFRLGRLEVDRYNEALLEMGFMVGAGWVF